MRRFSLFITLVFLGFAYSGFAQKTSEQYYQAASAYQSGDFPTAEKLWLKLADQGDANAQYALSIMHLKKEAQNAEDATAFRYLVAASKKQHLASMFNLGVAYWEGRGVERQREKALNWWEIAARRNDAGAQYNLGLAYFIGEGRAQNTSEAIYWVQQAVNNYHPQAQALLVTIEESISDPNNAKDKDPELDTSTKPKGAIPATAPTDSKQTDGMLSSIRTTVLHAAPDANSVQISTLEAGVPVRRIQTSTGWTQVLVSRSYPVWVYETFLENLNDGQGIIRGSNVNIRPSASTNDSISPPLGQLEDGQRVDIITRYDSWVQIMPPEPFPAWVFTQDIQ
jgi:SH3-like domain-containing protein